MTSTKENNISLLILTLSFYPSPMGGAEIQALRLAKELKKKGFDVWVVTLAQRGQSKTDVLEGINIYRIRLFFSPFYYSSNKKKESGPVKVDYGVNDQRNFVVSKKKSFLSVINYFIFLWNAYFFLLRKNIAIIYVPMMEWLAFVAILLGKLTGKKVIIKDSTMNGLTNLLRYPLGRQMRKVICNNGHFISMTRVIRSSFIEAGIPESKIVQIPNGIELPEEPRRNVNMNKFIFVGNLNQQPAKGIDILLKAWRIVITKIPSAQLYIIGEGSISSYIEFADKLGISGNVQFMGKQSSFKNHLLESLAFILPSRREGMSNALLEAMSLGLTCIATDISGNQDLIVNDVNGILIPVEDDTALASAVMYVHSNLEKALAMGVEARRTIEKNNTLSIVSERYDKLFRSLASR